jgi:branched-chain amino acid aminotransferase
MVHRFIFHNKQLLPMEQARLSPGQAGLVNGWGLFSTLRVYDGQPFEFERHWKRLTADGARIQMPLPYASEAVHRHMLELIAANGVISGCVRIYFIHNRIGIWHGEEEGPEVDLILCTSDLPVREGAARLSICEQGRHAAHPLAGTKVTSWLSNAWALEQAHQRGFDDALLLNERGEVAECTSANVFWVAGGRVFTPPLSSGCLAGVTRQILLEIASQDLAITERAVSRDEIQSAQEVFITSTTRQVQAVCQIEETLFPEAGGPITSRMADLFSSYVRERIKRADRTAEVGMV